MTQPNDNTTHDTTASSDEQRMVPDEIWNCDDRYRAAGAESPEHLWPKPELHHRKRNRVAPWFPGTYRFEKTVADLVPDCIITGGPVNRWIEFVARSEQDYLAKTRAALRLGFVIHWVFHTEQQTEREVARRELAGALEAPFSFGVYDPWTDVLDLGDPITYKNFAFPVHSMLDFSPRAMLGYRAGEAAIGKTGGGFDLGLFEIAGCQRRVISFDDRGTYFRAITPGQAVEDTPWGFPTRTGLARLVDAGYVIRLGPVGEPATDENETPGI